MKNLYGGLVVFIVHIGLIFITPKLLATANTAPWWYSVILGLITVLYIHFGYQTIKKENHYLAGILFFVLGLINLFLLYISNAQY